MDGFRASTQTGVAHDAAMTACTHCEHSRGGDYRVTAKRTAAAARAAFPETPSLA